MPEDDTAFNAAYRALTIFERSLTVRQRFYASVRQVFRIPLVRVRFKKTNYWLKEISAYCVRA
jgi:hypothetical protein